MLHDFFASPGTAYNAINFALAVVGFLLGVAGLAFAYWQIAKTLNAATAAKLASEATATELRRVAIVIDVQKLSAFCREVRASASPAALVTLSRPLHDLRVGLAELRGSPRGRLLRKPAEWDLVIASVAEVQQRVESPAIVSDGEEVVRAVLTIAAEVDEELHAMSSRAAPAFLGGV